MRIKANDDFRFTGYLAVFLNGEDVSRLCTEADDSEGYVTLIKGTQTQEGHIVAEADKNSEPITEKKFGRVELTLNPDAPNGLRLEFERRKQQEK